MPSHLWEHFSASPQSLALLARHKGSRDPMPAKLSDVLCKGWSSFSSVTPALELQQQVGPSVLFACYLVPWFVSMCSHRKLLVLLQLY